MTRCPEAVVHSAWLPSRCPALLPVRHSRLAHSRHITPHLSPCSLTVHIVFPDQAWPVPPTEAGIVPLPGPRRHVEWRDGEYIRHPAVAKCGPTTSYP